MKADGQSTDALTALKPLEVASYLRVHGWRQEAELDGKGSVWVLPGTVDRDEADVRLPLRRDLVDFSLRMSEIVRTLAQVERRREEEVVSDLLTTGSDLIRVRAPSRNAASGSLPLEEAVAFVERSRDMMMAAACAAISKRPCFATRKPARATECLGKVRMGQTERGSYILTILSPVAPALTPDGELPLELEPPEPYERQVVRTLAESLAALEGAARQAAASGGMSAFDQAVRLGVSANLCEAVAGLSAVSPGEGLDISIAWSRTRSTGTAVPSCIVLGSDSIPLILEAARLFKDTAPIEDVELQGFVTRLSRRPQQEPGEIILEGLIDGDLRRVAVRLVGDEVHSRAVQAHEQRERVACAGDLVKEGRVPAGEPATFPAAGGGRRRLRAGGPGLSTACMLGLEEARDSNGFLTRAVAIDDLIAPDPRAAFGDAATSFEGDPPSDFRPLNRASLNGDVGPAQRVA